ncbi:MAG TPA: FAD-dependent oxidoreductase, partial [Woeseiaceae bacterium]
FNRRVVVDAETCAPELTIGEYVSRHRYSRQFTQQYLIPMAAAIWSAEPGSVEQMPLPFLVRFFRHHGLLSLNDRPQWRVVSGGSRQYVDKLTHGFRDRIRLTTPVQWIRRRQDAVIVKAANHDPEHFDQVFVATHSDQALALLADPSKLEQRVLGAMPYQKNEAVLHTDETVLPKRRRAWAAWNYHIPAEERNGVAVTYNMNLLQGLQSASQYCVTLNYTDRIDPAKILRRFSYDHPVFRRESIAAQSSQAELNAGRTFFCGAYWRNGFHEDGVVSALAAIRHFEEATACEKLHFRRAG